MKPECNDMGISLSLNLKIMKKSIYIIIICMFLLPVLHGQEEHTNFPDGFHIGITGEGNFAQRMNIIPIGTGYVDPISAPTMGWQTGVEFSYHFAGIN